MNKKACKQEDKSRNSKGQFLRGKVQTPKGRLKGSANKFTDLKQAYLDVFDKIEKKSQKKDNAIKSFFEWATKNDRNQGMFYQMVAKMLPSSVGIDGSIKQEHRFSMADFKKSMEEYDKSGD